MSIESLCVADQAVGAVRRHLRLESCPPLESRFEILRATVWSLAASSSPTYVSRVIAEALPAWRLLSERVAISEETLRAELHDALSRLEDAGDLVALRGGYWAPAVTRVVMLPDRAGYLLVGGAPCALLQLDDEAVQLHGPHRHLTDLPAELEAALPLEGFDSWTRRPKKRSLQEWAREVFESLERAPYSSSGASADAFEFYLPANAQKRTPQFFRWRESAENISGTLLARRRRLYGAKEYRLVDVCAGRIVSACELHNIDVRRLMYALDLEAENPVSARPSRVGDQTEWLFKSELPRAEQRAFAALGTLAVPDERHFERRWTFTRNEELALGMLRELGITLEEHRGEQQ